MPALTDLNPTVRYLTKQQLQGTSTLNTFLSARCVGGNKTRGMGFTFSNILAPAWLTVSEPFSLTFYWSFQSNGEWQKASLYPLTDLYLNRFYTVYDLEGGISFSLTGVGGFSYSGGSATDRGLLFTFTELP